MRSVRNLQRKVRDIAAHVCTQRLCIMLQLCVRCSEDAALARLLFAVRPQGVQRLRASGALDAASLNNMSAEDILDKVLIRVLSVLLRRFKHTCAEHRMLITRTRPQPPIGVQCLVLA